MLLAIDIGNTNIVFAVYKDGIKKRLWRCKTDSEKTSDEYFSWLFQLFKQSDMVFSDISDAVVSSVVPDANFHIRQFCEKSLGCKALFVSKDNMEISIGKNFTNPSEIGADRLVNVLAVTKNYEYPAIIVDFGTATTFDVINEKGEYHGGLIAPGIGLSLEALHSAAAKLPKVSIKKPPSIVAGNTVEAMQSGIYWGYVSLIEGVLKKICKETGYQKPFIIATGGLADLYANDIDLIDKVDGELILKGLLEIYYSNARHKQIKTIAT